MAEQLARLRLEAVITGCREEQQRARRDELGYCFELFRRALEERDQTAWGAIDAQYRRLLLDWVYAARGAETPEEAEDTAREALARFWRTLAGKEGPVGARFPHIGALLKYLQQCVVSTVLDARRRDQQRARLAERLRANELLAPAAPGPEEQAVEFADRADQIARVRGWVQSAVSDPAEQLVLQLSYRDGLTPQEIAQRHPAEFPDAAAVRQIKERVLRRARRALVGEG